MSVVILAGGTGGAKLARGLLDVVGDDLVVIANTGDDVEIHGAHVSPDPDLCTFWLADTIDARGWGIDGDTFAVMDGLRALGREVWFNVGDRDLALCLERKRRTDEGQRLTDAHAALVRALGVTAAVLPMSDDPVRTRVQVDGQWWGLQEFMIRNASRGPIQDVAFDGLSGAAPSPEVLAAIAGARVIVVGPSNPVISIGPILGLPGLPDALRSAAAPVIAVSPIVGGRVLKGPTAAFMDWAGHKLSADGIAEAYAGVIDGLIADEQAPAAGIPVKVCDTRMDDAGARARLARATLQHAGAAA